MRRCFPRNVLNGGRVNFMASCAAFSANSHHANHTEVQLHRMAAKSRDEKAINCFDD